MRQVLFYIPGTSIPIYGFGTMLFLAFLACLWLGTRRAVREGVAKEFLQDLALWVFGGGLIGARIVYILSHEEWRGFWHFLVRLPQFWDGGIVFYGSVLGGIAGYLVGWMVHLSRARVPTLKLADIVAPTVAMGLLLGRLGCFLNGCCYGQVTCTPLGVQFPLSAPARYELVQAGNQSTAGFTYRVPAEVGLLESGTSAWKAGARLGDQVVAIDGRVVHGHADLLAYLIEAMTAGQREFHLTVRRQGQQEQLKPLIVEKMDDPSPDRDKLLAAVGLSLTAPEALPPIVGQVEPRSAAEGAGLKAGDRLVKINGEAVKSIGEANRALIDRWPRGQAELRLTIERDGQTQELPAFAPLTRKLHPTQLYESISMAIVLVLLLLYTPLKKHDGQVMAVMMIAYAIHRYVNELLRIDTRPVGFESWGSVILLVAGVRLFVWHWWKPQPEVVVGNAIFGPLFRRFRSGAA